MHHFTPNDLVLYISGEMPLIESNALEQALMIDASFFQNYINMQCSWLNTKQLELQPSNGFTDRLMSRIENSLFENVS